MEGFVVLREDPMFPGADVAEIARRLELSGILVPGFAPPSAGVLSIPDVRREQLLGARFVLLVDRNIASRMARIARAGLPTPLHTNDSSAINLMAYAQAMDFQIEPSIAFHELAEKERNDGAHNELAWFRAADKGNAKAWIDLAMGRSDRITFDAPPEPGSEDLEFPLMRWRRNYVMALEIAKLELTVSRPLDRMLTLADWMYDDYQWGGPASVFATMYFGPKAKRRGLIKDVNLGPGAVRRHRGPRPSRYSVHGLVATPRRGGHRRYSLGPD